jgi:hypothetical protein
MFGKALAAARLGYLLHLLECQTPHTCTIRTPGPFPNACWNSAPPVPTCAFPEQRDRQVHVERGNAPSTPLTCQRFHLRDVKPHHRNPCTSNVCWASNVMGLPNVSTAHRGLIAMLTSIAEPIRGTPAFASSDPTSVMPQRCPSQLFRRERAADG